MNVETYLENLLVRSKFRINTTIRWDFKDNVIEQQFKVLTDFLTIWMFLIDTTKLNSVMSETLKYAMHFRCIGYYYTVAFRIYTNFDNLL